MFHVKRFGTIDGLRNVPRQGGTRYEAMILRKLTYALGFNLAACIFESGRVHQSSSSQAGANCAKHPVELRAKGLSARRERSNALHSCRDLRLRGRYARGVRSANGQPQFAFGVESDPNSACSEAQTPALSSSQEQRRRRHPSFGRKR